jgi:hypothetical protein
MKRFISIFLIYGFSFTVVHSQFYSSGEAPARTKWKQLKTGHFTLVFPETMTRNACRMADLMEHYYSPTVGSYNPGFRKIPVILQQQSVLSNGYVTLAPWRMELITTAPQETYSQDWLSQLALHETRHVVQLASLNHGFIHGLGFLTGQISKGISAAQVPAWFFEGDAVDNETNLSLAGRGRQASFEMPLRTILDSRRKMFSYDKSLFGSYRDYVPDHYHFGYEIVKYGRTRFNDTIWSDAINFVARHPYIIWPFAIRMKIKYGVFNSGMYRKTMKSLDQKYDDQKVSDHYMIYKPINQRKSSIYTSYSYAYSINELKLVTYRKGLNDPGSFIFLDSSGYEKKLLTTGYRQGERFDIKMDNIVWDEVHSDPRWAQRSYSVIRTLNIKTGKIKTLTRKSRYFAPCFSPDMDKIAVSENDVKGDNYLTILETKTGKILNRISVDNKEIKNPVWTADNEVIFITVSSHGKSLVSVKPETSALTVLIPETTTDLSDPAPLDEYVLFSADATGRNDLYAVNKSSGELYRITYSQYGALYPTVSEGSVYFSSYSSRGYDICRLTVDQNTWEKITGFEKSTDTNKDSIQEGSYSVQNFSKTSHLINIHSWLPFYVNLNEIRDNSADIKAYTGLMLFNQNLLSTFTSTIGYNYYKGYSYFRPEIEFKGWYPVIKASAFIGGPQQSLGIQKSEIPKQAPVYNSFNVETLLPLYFSTGSYNSYIQPSVELEHSSIYYSNNNDLKRGLNLLHIMFNSGILKRMAPRQIYPALGQTFYFVYSRGVGDQRIYGNMSSAEGTTYLPGLLRNHSLIFRYGIEKQNPDLYFMPFVRIDFPRGYHEYVSELFASLKVNYSFPVVYPDLALGPLIYVKRIRANLFYDTSYGRNIRSITNGYSGDYNSFGTDLLFDFHALRILFPASAGIRMGYKSKENKTFTELLFSVNMNRF